MTDLEVLVARQVAYVERQPGERLLLALPRFVQFINEDARLHAIVDDIVLAYREAIEAFREFDRRQAEKIASTWRSHGGWLPTAWDGKLKVAGKDPVWAKM